MEGGAKEQHRTDLEHIISVFTRIVPGKPCIGETSFARLWTCRRLGRKLEGDYSWRR